MCRESDKIRQKGAHHVFLMEKMDMLAACETAGAETNFSFLADLVRAVRYAAECELTQRQRLCFLMHFENKIPARAIARELGVSDSTVSRHIAAACEKIRRHARYCVLGRAPGGTEGEMRWLG